MYTKTVFPDLSFAYVFILKFDSLQSDKAECLKKDGIK